MFSSFNVRFFLSGRTSVQWFISFLTILLATNILPAQVHPVNVDIVRDKWGVPHIYGKTDADATYGLAWATCEDDFNTVQKMLLTVRGRLGEVDGKGGAVLDFLSFISAAEEVAYASYDTSFSPAYKKVVEAYTQGVNEYAAAHPEEVLRKGLFPVTPKDVVAQYIVTNMLLTNVYLDIQKIFNGEIKNYEENRPSGSNAIAISGSRTKEGNTFLAVNSHQPLEGLFSWYEAHLVSEEGLDILGGTFPGGMSIFHGTNKYLGWACTLNHPDLDDVYLLQMNPKNHLQYWMDDHWETLRVRKKTVKVKLGAIRLPVTKTFYWSKYGTTIEHKGKFYSVRFASNMDIKGGEQLYELNKTKSFTEWRNVMRKMHLPGVNFIYADPDTIFYVSNAQLPYRHPQYNWKKVLPGNTSATLWPPVFHPFDSLPQVLNPKSGYLLNTNNSCFDVTATGDNPICANYDPTYGYGTDKNNRSIMAHFLIHGYDKLSYEDFKRVKYNRSFNDSIYDYGLNNAELLFHLSPLKYPKLKDAIAVLHQWNCESDANNKEAALVTFAMYPLIDKITAKGTIYESNSFTEKEYAQALRSAKHHLLKYFGSLTVPLGEVQKHVRGNIELPVGGMPDVIAATLSRPYKKGMRQTFVGDSYIQLVRFSKDTIQLETVNAFGASAKPGSAHYTDQMQLFADQKLKPMTMNRELIYKEAERIYHPQGANRSNEERATE